MITDVFLDQKRLNICEHMVKEASHDRFGIGSVGASQEGGRSGGNGGKIEWKSFEVNTRAVTRGQNELIGEFKMVAGDVISIMG